MSDYKDFYEQHIDSCDYCDSVMTDSSKSKDEIMELIDAHVTNDLESHEAQAEYSYEAWKEQYSPVLEVIKRAKL